MAFICVNELQLKTESKKRYDNTYETYIVSIEKSAQMINTDFITAIRRTDSAFLEASGTKTKKVPFCYYQILLASHQLVVDEDDMKKVFDLIGATPF